MAGPRSGVGVLITGPAGAGKTTVCEAWAASRARSAVVEQDALRRLVRSGFADPTTGWDDERSAQWALARRQCVSLADGYLRAGFDCAIDASYVPGPAGERYGDGEWPELLRSIGAVGPVVLLPSVEVLQERVAAREGVKRLPPPVVAMIHSMYAAWVDIPDADVIDSSSLSVEDTLQRVVRIVDARAAGARVSKG